MKKAPVITVDGPSGSGKGTLSKLLAESLGWQILDSGALYRVLSVAATRHNVSLEDEDKLAEMARTLDVRFQDVGAREPTQVILENKDITGEVRTESCGANASVVAAHPKVREALLQRQRDFAEPPGLVADGRDMGTVVFQDADFKVFLDASAEKRAERRFRELQARGLDVSLETLLIEIQKRDERDTQRATAPLKPASEAFILDTTELNIDQVHEVVLKELKLKNILS